MPEPTYYVTKAADGTNVYHCCHCERQGTEHHSADEALFIAHQEQRHDGTMVEDVEASAAKGKSEDTPGGRPDTPPGQEGEQPGNRPNVPPGQVPGEDEPHPEHPIVDPDAPYVEHHEEPKP